MKMKIRVLSWAIALSVGSLVFHSQKPIEADPVADFSFALQHVPGNRYNSVTLDRITLIFQRHLDSKPSAEEARRLAKHLVELCRKYRFEPAFILSLIQVESDFRVEVVSYAGAVGLMQIMPATARVVSRRHRIAYAGPKDLRDPKINMTLGVTYLAYLRDRYEGMSPYFHVAAYNIGPYRLDQLRSRKNFKPTKTMDYYEKIKKGVSVWRYYSLDSQEEAGA